MRRRIELSPRALALIRQFLATLTASWTCVSHGLLTGYTAQAIPSLTKEDSNMEMTEMHMTWISSIVPLVAVLFSCLSSPLCMIIGRRQTMMASCLPLCAGWLIITYATDGDMILIGRAVCGAASAVGLPAAYTYVAEIASSSTRGFLGSFMSVGWSFGLVLSYSLGSVLEWNWLALFSAIIPLVQFMVLSTSASSPRWLVSRGRSEEAKKSMIYFRGELAKHVECELRDCEHQIKVCEQGKLLERLKMMVGSSGVRKAVLTCLTIYLFTVATGFSVISYHAKAILVQAKVGETIDANLGIIVIGLCKMAGNIFSALIIDRVGRKTLLYVSSAFICISQALLGVYFHFQLTLPAAEISPYRWVPLLLLIIFVVFFPVGWGSITYILVSELVPTMVRTETAVLCNSWEQLLQFAMLQLHATVCTSYGPRFLHWGFSLASLFGALFVWKALPETSGKTLEQIETFFVHLRREALDMIGDSNACREPAKQPFFRFVILDDEKPSSKCGDCKSSTSDVIKGGNSDVIKTGKGESEPTSPKRRRSVPLYDIVEVPEESDDSSSKSNNINSSNNNNNCGGGGSCCDHQRKR